MLKWNENEQQVHKLRNVNKFRVTYVMLFVQRNHDIINTNVFVFIFLVNNKLIMLL